MATTAKYLGFDLATTKTGAGVRGDADVQAYADIDTRGVTRWHGGHAFELDEMAGMILETLDRLARDGWKVGPGGRALSFAVRQHDLVLLGKDGRPLIPALSWRCNLATAEVARLREMGAEQAVGRIEERFILPKLMWALGQQPLLRGEIAQVMTTGDWVALMLTGSARLSTSDALSNGLLVQTTAGRATQLADAVLRQAGLDPDWFPTIIPSGEPVGVVAKQPGAAGAWGELQGRLAGWRLVAGLGDNHATGVGCGGLADDRTIVVSAGTSGTINRRVRPAVANRGHAARFEFYDDRLLLMMLGDCGEWYRRFREAYFPGNKYEDLNVPAAAADLDRVVFVHSQNGREEYPAEFAELDVGEKVASTQFSIMVELLRLVRAMRMEATGGPEVTRYVLTGGLSQSPFFRHVFSAGVRLLDPGGSVKVSARTDRLSHQTAAFGAVINAMLPEFGGDLGRLVGGLCPLVDCPAAEPARDRRLQALLRPLVDT